MPRLSLVVAAAENRIIGHEGGLPWHIPADLKHFKRLTMGKPIVMGRKTFESIGRALPGRRNIVISRRPDWSAPGAERAASLEEAIRLAAADAAEIAIIGGAEIYAQAVPIAGRIYMTKVHSRPEGDTYFPELEPGLWRETVRQDHAAEDGRPAFSFVTLERTGPPPRH